AHLDVLYGSEFEECPPDFTEKLRDISAGKGDTVQLMAKIKAHPVPKIVWKKDGQELQMSPDKVFTSFNGEDIELTILNFDKSDVGIYEVCVGNSLGQISSTARVVEHAMTKPQFVRKLSDIEARLGSETKLTCQVKGYPTANIEWTLNGRPIESGSKYSIIRDDRNGEQVLIIFEPTLLDSGVYECVATNQVGSDRTSSNVLFGEKAGEAAHFITKLQDCDCSAGSTARFTACVVGNPTPDFKWFKDDKEITIDGSKYMFQCNPNGMITDGDIGRYRCMASNKFGCDNSVGQLNYESKAKSFVGYNGRRCSSDSSSDQIDHTNTNTSNIRLMLTRIRKIFGNSPTIVQMIYVIIVFYVSIILFHYLFPIDTIMSVSNSETNSIDDCSGSTTSDEVDSILKNLQEYIFRCSNNK
ncbi:Immunoglobulin domain containing protein, partial [Euroglyphus maynei]